LGGNGTELIFATGFYLNLPLTGLAIIIIWFTGVPNVKIPAPEKTVVQLILQRLDLIGFALFAPSCTMVLLALQWGGASYAWNSPTVIGLFAGSFGGFLVFIGWEWYEGDNAMIPPALLAVPPVGWACLSTFFSRGGVFLQGYYLPVWFQIVKQASPEMSGVYTMPSVIAQVIMAVTAGVLGASLFLPSTDAC
jgi:hypothetical protein